MKTRNQAERAWTKAADAAYRSGWKEGTRDRYAGRCDPGVAAAGPFTRAYLQGYRYGQKGIYGDEAA